METREATVTAVVLGGGEPSDSMAREAGVEAKALVPVGGKPMGAYVLEALRGCPEVGAIVYVGPVNVRLEGLYDVAVPAGLRLADSLALGVGAALGNAPSKRLIILTADIPWVTASGLSAYLRAAPVAELVYPTVTEAAATEQFPHQRRTYVRMREGRLTGGNAVLLAADAVPRLLPFLDRAFRARKNPLALATLFGIDVLLAVMLGRASIDQVERRLKRLSGIDARALVTDDAALAADVDRATHLPGVLGEGQPGGPRVEA